MYKGILMYIRQQKQHLTHTKLVVPVTEIYTMPFCTQNCNACIRVQFFVHNYSDVHECSTVEHFYVRIR